MWDEACVQDCSMQYPDTFSSKTLLKVQNQEIENMLSTILKQEVKEMWQSMQMKAYVCWRRGQNGKVFQR